jgi:hypothetical protein
MRGRKEVAMQEPKNYPFTNRYGQYIVIDDALGARMSGSSIPEDQDPTEKLDRNETGRISRFSSDAKEAIDRSFIFRTTVWRSS